MPRVHKDHCLRHFAHIEDLFEEVGLLTLLTTVLKLLDVRKRELLLFKADLLSCTDKVRDLLLHVVLVGRREEDVLDFLGQLLDVVLV